MEFLYLFIIIIIAFAVTASIKLKIEQSIFLTVCAFFAIEFISGLIFDLDIGYYIIISLAILSLAFVLYKIITKNIEIKELLTPGLSLFILSFIIYYFSSRTAMLHLWDEATHWGIAAKKMAFTGKLWTTGMQSIASPVFNFVMLKTTGFNEGSLYLSQYTLSFACLILPLSYIKWRRAYWGIAYFIGAYLALSFMTAQGNLTLYADGILGLFFASMVIAWYVEKKFSYKKYIWAATGLFMLVQIKNGTGISLSILFILIVLILDRNILNKHYDIKKHTIHAIISIVILSCTLYISNKLYSIFNNVFLGSQHTLSAMSSLYEKSPLYPIFMVLRILLIIIFISYFYLVFKNKTTGKIFKVINLSAVTLFALTTISYIGLLFHKTLTRPNFDIRTTVLNFLSAFTKYKIFDIPIKYIILTIIILSALNIIFSSKEKQKDYMKLYFSTFMAFSLLLAGTLYTYLAKFSLHEAINTASFDRYIGTGLIIIALFSLMPFLDTEKGIGKKIIIPKIAMIIVIMLMIINHTPVYKLAQNAKDEALVIRESQIKSAEFIKSIVDRNDKVFIIIQEDSGFAFYWMRYELAPIGTNGGYWSLGRRFKWDEDELIQFFIDANYDYLYIHKSDNVFVENFTNLFGNIQPESKKLYKFNSDQEIIFTPIGSVE